MESVLYTIAELMAVSAITAPKAKGEDCVRCRILDADRTKQLADMMERYGAESGRKGYERDAAGVRASKAVLLLSLKNVPAGLNCGACGNDSCEDLKKDVKRGEFEGPVCAWRLIDLGIAAGSAAKTAQILNVDNRIMYRIGTVAKKEGLIEGEVVLGIPLSASAKNIFFDR